MERNMTAGNEPLGDTGLVAFTPCGHWWVYRTPATAEQMHDVARSNLGIVCSFCLGDRHAATCAHARGPAGRAN